MQHTNEIKAINKIDTETISDILQKVEDNEQVEIHLPGGGFLQINEELPYLLTYRMEHSNDHATVRLILSESSYLVIGLQDFEGYQNLIYALSEKLSSKFKSFLVMEIYRSETDNTVFTIKGPAKRLSSSLEIFKEELLKLNRRYEFIEFGVKIEDTPKRQKENTQELLSIQQAKQSGCLLLGLEIPAVYQNSEGEEYPVFFRSFRDDFLKAIHEFVYHYIRVQTTSGATSYLALGKKKLKNKVFQIDKELAEIESSFNFLWLVSPSNIRQIKDTFFESNYEKVLNYHYRLLPIDPNILKRRLYNLKIDEVDDPAMSFILNEKREELDQQITMLNERGTKNFFYSSIRLYKGVEKNLQEEALKILHDLHEEDEELNIKTTISAEEFKTLAENETNYYRKQDPDFKSQIKIRDDVNILMVSRGELLIPSDTVFNMTEAEALIQHEVGTHMLTYFNGTKQPLKQLAVGFADYDTLQEGIAVLSEYLVEGLTINRIRLLAGRVVAGQALLNGADFQEIFQELCNKHGFNQHAAFNITSRIMQGGGFIKDVIYLRGLVEIREFIKNGGNLESLLLGKYALKHLKIIEELLDRKVLKQPQILPSYLHSEKALKRLNKIKEGLPLSKMIEK